jgi:hypothetical protein
MKEREVLVKVFDPGRLLMAWQQVRRIAGAPNLDQDGSMAIGNETTSSFRYDS